MPCPTCGHTMKNIAPHLHWCQRCGTLRETGLGAFDEVPALVERCREFAEMLGKIDTGEAGADDFWTALGIAESINLPGHRHGRLCTCGDCLGLGPKDLDPADEPAHTEEDLKGGME